MDREGHRTDEGCDDVGRLVTVCIDEESDGKLGDEVDEAAVRGDEAAVRGDEAATSVVSRSVDVTGAAEANELSRVEESESSEERESSGWGRFGLGCRDNE